MELSHRAQRNCPVCGSSPETAKLYFAEHLDASKLTAFSFASRKVPEYLCYQMVQCPTCDLVYVDQPPSQQALAEVYHAAHYDSSEEADDAAAAYARVIQPILGNHARGCALEIGAGTGVFLDKLKQNGFDKVCGIEPSTAAIAAAPAHRQGWLREGIFVESDYEAESFDLICCFMTLEHVREPREIVCSALNLLKPGGVFVSVTHDYRSIVNRLMGKRSPILDIEHMQLFSARSIEALLVHAGYTGVQAQPFMNRYTLRYWTRLAPLPSGIKTFTQNLLASSGLGAIKISMNVGNTVAFGYKPGQ
ncbi:class I SAM-dependent methyltransferase [Paraburkholderia hayleyella]|uniref:class I SAM-dependent methyltransferase n=1 Tax=Paraburkholderia hayleyella TaxID=2152889 RepID=UPI0012911948|nr:class I SAM-dependent methyltransferase [Paraburkholderia hayleyella]